MRQRKRRARRTSIGSTIARIDPPEGGVNTPSFIKCEDVRSVAKQRLSKRWGAVSPVTMQAVEDRIRILLQESLTAQT